MSRLTEIDEHAPDVADTLAQIKQASGSRQLPNVHKALAHSPPLLKAWQPFFNVVRRDFQLSGRHRELVILRVAALNGSGYSFSAHIDIALREGVTQEQIDILGQGLVPPGLDDGERAIVAYTDAITRSVSVTDGEFAAVRTHLGERATVELTGLVAAYNMQTRFVLALGVETDAKPD